MYIQECEPLATRRRLSHGMTLLSLSPPPPSSLPGDKGLRNIRHAAVLVITTLILLSLPPSSLAGNRGLRGLPCKYIAGGGSFLHFPLAHIHLYVGRMLCKVARLSILLRESGRIASKQLVQKSPLC